MNCDCEKETLFWRAMIWPDVPFLFSLIRGDPGTFLGGISNSFFPSIFHGEIAREKKWLYIRGSGFLFDLVCESSNHGEGRRVYAGTDDDSRDESSFIRRHHGPISFSTTAALKSGSLPLWNLIHTEDYVQVESAMHPNHSVNLEIMRNLDRYVPCLDYSDTLLPCSSFFFFNTCATNAN